MTPLLINPKFTAALAVASVIAIYAARMLELNAKREVIAGKVQELFTFRLFMMTGTLMLLCSLAEFFVQGPRPPAVFWGCFVAGWLCALASFVIRRRAIAALGKFWSLHVEIRDNHEFVRSGPFRWVRHPTYFSMFLELLSIGLILDAFAVMVAVPFLFIPVLLMRIRMEETALVAKFGDAYREYQRSTPAVMPLRWPKP
jgi:protein-S-isoprenylcysteine O-methyltransferase Ste14